MIQLHREERTQKVNENCKMLIFLNEHRYTLLIQSRKITMEEKWKDRKVTKVRCLSQPGGWSRTPPLLAYAIQLAQRQACESCSQSLGAVARCKGVWKI